MYSRDFRAFSRSPRQGGLQTKVKKIGVLYEFAISATLEGPRKVRSGAREDDVTREGAISRDRIATSTNNRETSTLPERDEALQRRGDTDSVYTITQLFGKGAYGSRVVLPINGFRTRST